VYPAEGRVTVNEVIDGEPSISHYGDRTWIGQWYRLRVDADSATGAMAIYVDDVYQGTDYAQTANRGGLSGLSTGNFSAEFDDFSIESVPDPGATLLLLSMGLAGPAAF
jgi:hypothetical protein